MTRFVLFSLPVMLCCFNKISAQVYNKMLGDSTDWFIVNYYNGYNTDHYFAADDTMILGISYKILDGFHFNRHVFLREDTVGKKIYYRQIAGFKANQDILLYNFNLQPGDSMLLFNPNSTINDSVGYFILDSIATFPVLTGTTRKFYLSKSDGSDYAVWLEGIGSLSLINSSSGKDDAVEGSGLSCYFHDGQHVYQSDLALSFNSCLIQTVGISNSPDQNNFRVFPNPVYDQLNIILPGYIENGYLILSDFTGSVVQKVNILNQNSLCLDMIPLSAGIYFIRIESEKSQLIYKIIKI